MGSILLNVFLSTLFTIFGITLEILAANGRWADAGLVALIAFVVAIIEAFYVANLQLAKEKEARRRR